MDVVCDNANEGQISRALDFLKKMEGVYIYWMKFRNCEYPHIKNFAFLGLSVGHLNIIRSKLNILDQSSLSALGNSLTDLDLSNNELAEVRKNSIM